MFFFDLFFIVEKSVEIALIVINNFYFIDSLEIHLKVLFKLSLKSKDIGGLISELFNGDDIG